MLKRIGELRVGHRCLAGLLATAVVVVMAAGATWAGDGDGENAPRYDVRVRRTSFGIPHIKARDWGSLGYGSGYAFAQDNLCVLARDIVEARGQLSRYFGPGNGNLESDLFYTYWTDDEIVRRFRAATTPELQKLIRGYAAGYNRYLRDTGVSALPQDCRNAAWVNEIDEADLYKLYHKLLGLAGVSNLIGSIVEATPPPPLAPALAGTAPSASEPGGNEGDALQRVLAAGLQPDATQLAALRRALEWKPEEVGSNVLAVGGEATTNARGLLLVNPHFPWTGPLRFYQLHVTLPGQVDSMGAALFGAPVPLIAFNRYVAWSHTVSAARRFTLHQLTLAADDPTVYLVDGERHPMTATTVAVEVLQPDGSLVSQEHTFYESHFGPIMAVPLFGWLPNMVFAVQDVNRENFRIFQQYLRMNQARSVDELAQALEEEIGLPWVNTGAVDREGNAYYADIGAIPHLTDEKYQDCKTALSAFVRSFGTFLVDGSRSECQLGVDPDAPVPGIFGASHLPSLRRRDYVQNSNDSYWLANPEEPLEGFASILGGERQPQGLRTRLGIVQVRERLEGSDGLPGRGFNLERLQAVFHGNRNHSAELMLDGVLTLCDEEPLGIDVGGKTVDVGPACALLAGWDRSQKLDAVGAQIWREFWDRIRGERDLYALPFDANDPVETPRGLNLGSPSVRAAALQALAEAVLELERLGIPLDARWGEVHFETRPGERIPIPGGLGNHGVYNAIYANPAPGKGYTPISAGSSIVQVVSFGRRGPRAEAVLTYSQSTDPQSPHFSDQTRLFSESRWNRLPFSERDIRRDPALETLRLREGPKRRDR